MNLTQKPIQLKGPRRLATAALSLLLGAFACTSALALRLQVATPSPAPQTQTLTPTAAPPAQFFLAVPHPDTAAPAKSFKLDIADASTPAKASKNQAANPSDSSTLPSHPTVIYIKPPEYPAASIANKEQISGDVIVSLIVGKDGVPKQVAVRKSMRPDFDQSAIAAVKQYRFKPALLHGDPVECPLFIDVNFQRF